MSVGLNAAQARSKASQDMIVFKETQTIMEKVIEQSGLGKFEALVEDGTTMTISTPSVQKIGTVNNPRLNHCIAVIQDNAVMVVEATKLPMHQATIN